MCVPSLVASSEPALVAEEKGWERFAMLIESEGHGRDGVGDKVGRKKGSINGGGW